MHWLLVATSLLGSGLPADARVRDFIAPEQAAAGESLQVFRTI